MGKIPAVFRISLKLTHGLPLVNFIVGLNAKAFSSAISDRPSGRRLLVEQNRSSQYVLSTNVCSALTKIISDCCRSNRLNKALRLFDKMSVRDAIAWNSMIKGCLDCGAMDIAERLFDEMPERTVISWTTMINGYFENGEVQMAAEMFSRMPVRDTTAWNSMLHGYCINGRVHEALSLFNQMSVRNVISWTSMICGLDLNGRSIEALKLFRQMLGCGIHPTSSTLSSVIVACGNMFSFEGGLQSHALVWKMGFGLDEFITSSLITFYAKCKRAEDFYRVFSEKKVHENVVVWTSLLTGHNLNSMHECALNVFSQMIRNGVLPNQFSFTSALNSCSDLEALDRGKEIHAVSIKLGLKTDVFVGNSLVALYSRCGSIKDGLITFELIETKNIVSWNSIIIGCAQHGYSVGVLAAFAKMIRCMIEPDEITLTGLLYACSHSGILLKGRQFIRYFSRYRIGDLKPEHYACMVENLSRLGKVEEAEELLENMPAEANSTVWLALLSACKSHSNLEVAERAAKRVFDLNPNCSAAYILLSNMYASANRWSDVLRIRRELKNRGILKQQGCSWFTSKENKLGFLFEGG